MKKNKPKSKKMETTTVLGKRVRVVNGKVTLSIKEYERLLQDAVPVEYLSPKEAARLDKLVKQALRDYKNNKLIKISSLADLQ